MIIWVTMWYEIPNYIDTNENLMPRAFTVLHYFIVFPYTLKVCFATLAYNISQS